MKAPRVVMQTSFAVAPFDFAALAMSENRMVTRVNHKITHQTTWEIWMWMELVQHSYSQIITRQMRICIMDLPRVDDANPSYSKLPKRRDELMIAAGTINGCLTRILLDTGFTAGLILDPAAAERCSVTSTKVV